MLCAVAAWVRRISCLGSDSGGERAAGMYGLIGSARMNGLDPEACLRYVLTHIADYPIDRVADLLPQKSA